MILGSSVFMYVMYNSRWLIYFLVFHVVGYGIRYVNIFGEDASEH